MRARTRQLLTSSADLGYAPAACIKGNTHGWWPILFFVLEEGEGGESWRANMIAFQVIYSISTNADCDVFSRSLPNYLIDYVV